MTAHNDPISDSDADPRSAPPDSKATFPAALVAQAIRHGPYSTSAHALAEIVDNSFDANAKNIHIAIICPAGQQLPHMIAVLDDGNGMDTTTLRHCIQHGAHMGVGRAGRGIGKFGVGLLSASFHQCKDLEVYSWNNGLDKAAVNATRIQVENCPSQLPEPQPKPLPDFFAQSFATFTPEETELNSHGTLVVWRETDRLTWRKAITLDIKLTDELGRIYRNFLSGSNPKLKIVISRVTQNDDGTFEVLDSGMIEPADPLFLHRWDDLDDALETFEKHLTKIKQDPKLTLFEAYDIAHPGDNAKNEDGTYKEYIREVKDDRGQVIGSYRIMASHRRREIVRAAAKKAGFSNPGSAPYGTLAEKLRGISILRGGREISLDTNWLRADLTIDRWVSLSIDFDPSLDDIFGISNDKQRAGFLSVLAQIKTKDIDLHDEEYNKHVVEAAQEIQRILSQLRRIVGADQPVPEILEQLRPDSPDQEAIPVLRQQTDATAKRVEEDPNSRIPDVDGVKTKPEVAASYVNTKINNDQPADQVRPEVVSSHDLKLDFVSDHVTGGSDIFTPVNTHCGMILVKLNAQHPLYGKLENLLAHQNAESDDEEITIEELKNNLESAVSIIRSLFYAFSRAEIEAGDRHQGNYQTVRVRWGIVAKDLFDDNE